MRPAPDQLVVALDAMGGDHAPAMVVAGADRARKHHPDVEFVIFGDESRIEPLLRKRKALAEISRIAHTTDVITNDTKPSVALRTGRQSSMRKAIDAVGSGEPVQRVLAQRGMGAQRHHKIELAGVVQHVHQLAVGMAEILSETVQCDDHPVCVAAETLLNGRFRVSDDGFLGERYEMLREAG